MTCLIPFPRDCSQDLGQGGRTGALTVGKVLSEQAQGPEFRSGIHIKSWAWQGIFAIPNFGVEDKQETLCGMLGTNLEEHQWATGAVRDPVSE